jgi:RNA recognition motif-containing protein
VKFSTPGAQQRAINALNGAEIDGRYLEAREDLKSAGAPAPTRGASKGGKVRDRSDDFGGRSGRAGDEEYGVYIAGLPWRIAWQDLKDMCAEYGAVIYADVATEGGVPNGRSLGWGRVKFSTPGAQQRAINALNGAEIDGRYLEAREDLRG